MKAAFHTLGCKVNSYETQAVLEQFQENGFTIVPFQDTADVYIVNTCSVTAEAARKSRQVLHRCKKKAPEAIVVAAGCYAQEVREELLEDQTIDLVVGNNEKNKLLEAVSTLLQQKKKDPERVLYEDLTHCTVYEEQSISNQGDHVRAYVKIQDGCDRFCSYCIIPYLRGRSRSRSKDDILNEVKTLAQNGYQEVVLTGIDVSDYKDNGISLADIISLVNSEKGIERIRLSSLEERIITREFLQVLSSCEKFCPHFHLSLQSGCDKTLQRMNRHYSAKEFLKAVSLIREYFPDAAITTDVIVGFPGESKEDFVESMQMVEQAAFAQLHVFPFSRRKGTKADQMSGQLTRAEKGNRVASMMALGAQLQKDYLTSFVGKELSVLIEEEVTRGGEVYQVGYSRNYLKCMIKKEEKLINKIVTFIPKEAEIIQDELVLK